MPHVFLPTEHSNADLVLAGQIAELLESDSLYVTWSGRGYVEPEVETLLRVERAPAVPAPAPAPAPAGHSLLAEVLGRTVAFVAAVFGPRPAPQKR